MTDRKPPISQIVHAWTDSELDVWNAWSQVEQDVSQPESTHTCGHVLDAMEASARQAVTMQSAVLSGVCGLMSVNPLLPDQGRALIESACEPLLRVSSFQQHLLAAWFGMARQVAVSTSGTLVRS